MTAAKSEWRTFEVLPLTPILEAALDAFNENGYHATTVRELAQRVGVTIPALYYHHDSKEDILVALFESSMSELNDRVADAAQEAGADAVAQFANVIEAIILYMTHRSRFAVLESELRHVPPDSRSRYVEMRKTLERSLVDLVSAGVSQGAFTTTNSHETARAVLGMCQSVARWYRAGGALTPEQVAAQYVDIALHTVGCLSDRPDGERGL